MAETPREYKKRIDEKWVKNAKNKKKLIKKIEQYELMDDRYKAKTIQEILSNFEKNEQAEKSSELYTSVGRELENIEVKYQTLQELRKRLESKRQEHSGLIEQMAEQNVDGADKTTLNLQMRNVDKIKGTIDVLEKEIKDIEKEITDRETEIKEIEISYGKRENIDTQPEEDTTNDDEPFNPVDISKTNAETLSEYKAEVLYKKSKINHTRGEIIRLLDEGTGIDEKLKEKIKKEISEAFSTYNTAQEGSLRMKAARYLDRRGDILSGDEFDVETRKIGGKMVLTKQNSEGEYGYSRGREECEHWYDGVGDPKEIDGKPAYIGEKDGVCSFVWGTEEIWKGFDDIEFDPIIEVDGEPVIDGKKGGKWYKIRGDKICTEYKRRWNAINMGGKPTFRAENNGREYIMWGTEQCGNRYDEVELGCPIEVSGKPAFWASNGGKYIFVWGTEEILGPDDIEFDDVAPDDISEVDGEPVAYGQKGGKWYQIWGKSLHISECDENGNLIEVNGKPVFIVKKNGKRGIMWGTEQYGDLYDEIRDPVLVGGELVFKAKKDGKWGIVEGTNQCVGEYDEIGDINEIGGKAVFKAEKDGKQNVIWGTEQCGGEYDQIGEIKNIGGKPAFIGEKDGVYSFVWGTEEIRKGYDKIEFDDIEEIGGEPVIYGEKGGKLYQMWGNKMCVADCDELDQSINIGGKPFFKAEKNGRQYMMRGTEQCGRGYDRVGDPKEIDGKPAFIAEKNGVCSFVWGTKEIWKGYDKIEFDEIQEVGGEPVIYGEKGGQWYKMRGNKMCATDCDELNQSINIGGKPFFKADKDGRQYMMWGTKQCGNWYDRVGDPKEIDGKPAFIGEKNGVCSFVWGTEEIWKGFDDINFDTIIEVGGEPVIYGEKGGKWYQMWGNKMCATDCDELDQSINIGGKPTFRAKKNGKQYMMWGTEQCGKGYNWVGDTKEIDGKPAFIAEKNYKYSFVWGTEEIWKGYDKIEFDEMQEVGGEPVIYGKKGGKWYQMWGNKMCAADCDELYGSINIGGKPFFKVGKKGRQYMMWGTEQYGGNDDVLDYYAEVNGKPAYGVEKDGKYYMMWGEEQCGDCFDRKDEIENLFDNEEDVIDFVNKHANKISQTDTIEDNQAEHEMTTSDDSVGVEERYETPREKREKIILDRYEKKLNRDELIKIIGGIDGINQEIKKKLEKEILYSFYDEFKKVISDEEYQNLDRQYRELQKTERLYTKKVKEVNSKIGQSMPRIEDIDIALRSILLSAMKLEDGSRWKAKKLSKAKDEWNELEVRQNELIEGIRKLNIEKKELELELSSQTQKYGEKKERKKLDTKELKHYEGEGMKDLKKEQSYKEYKEKYMKMIEDKERYMEELLKQIETVDVGISEEKRKEVVEELRLKMSEEIEKMKGGDEIIKLGDETEEWLKKNWKIMMKKMDELNGKIEEKEAQISELMSKGRGESSDEIFKNIKQEFDLRNELIELKNQYESIKLEVSENLKKYNGEEVEYPIVETWGERQKKLKRETEKKG